MSENEQAAVILRVRLAIQSRIDEAVRGGGPTRLMPETLVEAERDGWIRGLETAAAMLQMTAHNLAAATPDPTHQPPPEQAANESEMRG